MERVPDDSRDYKDSSPGKSRGNAPWGNGPLSVAIATFLGSWLATIGIRLLPLNNSVAGPLIILLGIVFLVSAWRTARRYQKIPLMFITVLLPTVAGIMIGIPLSLTHKHPAAFRATCQNHLKHLGLVLAMYGNESGEPWLPPPSSHPGQLMFPNSESGDSAIYPEILTDLSILYCPETKKTPARDDLTPKAAFDDQSYFYLGYRITNQDELEAFAQAYRENMGTEEAFDGVLTAKGITLQRLRAEDLGFGTDNTEGSAQLPLLIERPLAHIPGGSNVLYADGHVEFVKMNAKWPVTEEAMAVLLELDALGNESRGNLQVE